MRAGTAKRNALVQKLSAEPGLPILPIEEFFDGNHDLRSIGCNLNPHPGIGAFRSVFARVAGRPDVDAVYAQIAEIDAGFESWPFTDTVIVVGSISREALAGELATLEPDEVGASDDPEIRAVLPQHHDAAVLIAWWD